jgi:hypothetical protein
MLLLFIFFLDKNEIRFYINILNIYNYYYIYNIYYIARGNKNAAA